MKQRTPTQRIMNPRTETPGDSLNVNDEDNLVEDNTHYATAVTSQHPMSASYHSILSHRQTPQSSCHYAVSPANVKSSPPATLKLTEPTAISTRTPVCTPTTSLLLGHTYLSSLAHRNTASRKNAHTIITAMSHSTPTWPITRHTTRTKPRRKQPRLPHSADPCHIYRPQRRPLTNRRHDKQRPTMMNIV